MPVGSNNTAASSAAIGLLLAALTACAAPVGSLASPVTEAPSGGARFSALGGHGRSWGHPPRPLQEANKHSLVGGHVDFSDGGRRTWGLGAGALLQHEPARTTWTPVVSYRGEAPLSEMDHTTLFVVVQAMTVRVDEHAAWNLLSVQHLPVIAPLVGVRRYIPIGSGGLVVSQGAWASVPPPSLLLPGSFAADLPLGPLHLLPELRWDLSASVFRSVDAGAVLSGYLSLVLQID